MDKYKLIPEYWVKPFVRDICRLAKKKGIKLNSKDYPNGFGLMDAAQLSLLLDIK